MSKEVIFTFDGTNINVELGKVWPNGAKAEKEAEKYLKGIAIKDKVGHRPDGTSRTAKEMSQRPRNGKDAE
jgi:hypothetical protein